MTKTKTHPVYWGQKYSRKDFWGLVGAGTILVSVLVPLVGYLIVKITAYFLGSRLRKRTQEKRESLKKAITDVTERRVIFGYFHPYCNAGGGGERVLWEAIAATQERYPHVMNVVYTGDVEIGKQEMLAKVKSRFGIDLNEMRVDFIYLKKRYLVAPETWPRCTLIGQSLGSISLGYEAISALVPDLYIDTMGYAFTLPLVSTILDIPTAAYVHYPTISTDMLSRLGSSHTLKLIYWKAFGLLYGWVGSFADLVMTNSTWTANHVKSLWWGKQKKTGIVYPPTDFANLEKLDINKERENIILCISQFRPEKNHRLAIDAFADLVESQKVDAKLVLMGTVRGEDDKKKVYELRLHAREKVPDDKIEIICDADWSTVQEMLQKASIGTNTMLDEHFGMGIVEYMAAGLIPIVHASGGPKSDIVVPLEGEPTGFLATTKEEFTSCYAKVLQMDPKMRREIRERARISAKRFSREAFRERWWKRMDAMLKVEGSRRLERMYRTGADEN